MNVKIVTLFCTEENRIAWVLAACIKLSEEAAACITSVMEAADSSDTSVCVCHAAAKACLRRWLSSVITVRISNLNLILHLTHVTEILANLHIQILSYDV
jgi:hypothetical protein